MITDLAPVLHLTPAFANRYRTTIVGSDLAYVRLQPGARLAGFQVAVERLSGGQPVSFVETRTTQTQKVQRSIDVEANVLTVVAALVALAAALAIAQALARQTYADRRDDATLRGARHGRPSAPRLGPRSRPRHRRRGRGARGRVRGFRIAGGAAPARAAREPRFRAPSRRIGARGRGASPSSHWRRSWRGGPAGPRTGRGAEARRRTRPRGPGIVRPLTAGLGVRFATGRVDAPGARCGARRGRERGDLRRCVHVHRQPRPAARRPAPLRLELGPEGRCAGAARRLDRARAALTDDREVEGLALGTVTTIHINGQRVDVLAIDQLKGMTEPTLVAGRRPRRPTKWCSARAPTPARRHARRHGAGRDRKGGARLPGRRARGVSRVRRCRPARGRAPT